MDKIKICILMTIFYFTTVTFALNDSTEIVFNLENSENLPVYQILDISVIDTTLEVTNTYIIRWNLTSTFCGENLRTTRPISVWSYNVKYNGESKIFIPYVETKYQESGNLTTILDCVDVRNKTGVVEKHYFVQGIVKNNTDPFFYPFDTYHINYSWNLIDEYPILYSVNTHLSPNTYPIEDFSYIESPFMKGKRVYVGNNETKTMVGDISVFGNQVRPSVKFIGENRYTLVFPPVEVPMKEYGVFTDKVTVIAGWQRPPIIQFIFILSASILIYLSFNYFFDTGYSIRSFSLHSFTVWSFQEGLSQLIPSSRPLSLTVFDTIVFIPIVMMVLRPYLKSK